VHSFNGVRRRTLSERANDMTESARSVHLT
jgi:hypothetical protein